MRRKRKYPGCSDIVPMEVVACSAETKKIEPGLIYICGIYCATPYWADKNREKLLSADYNGKDKSTHPILVVFHPDHIPKITF